MKAFREISSYDFQLKRGADIINEIALKGKDYILKVDEAEFVNYLLQKYKLDVLTVYKDTETFNAPLSSKEKISNDKMYRYEENVVVDVYTFTIYYKYTGSEELFKVQPSSWIMTSYDIDVNARSQTVAFSFKIYKQEAEEFKREKSIAYKNAFANLDNINADVPAFNRFFEQVARDEFKKEKEKYLKENDFFSAINVKVNEDTMSVFSAPTVNKKVIPQPTVSKHKEFSSEPMMSSEMYNDVLKVVYASGKSMEKKPALYMNKDEEGLREQFLFVLETRYEGTTATGETFNRSGKTDILLKYANDGSNLFVAECKFWHGASEFHAAISQLFDRYLTWRDSKAALLMFVKNKDFSNVIATIKKEVKNHSLYISNRGNRGETSFSYTFCLPQDKQKQVLFEIMAFHYDK